MRERAGDVVIADVVQRVGADDEIELALDARHVVQRSLCDVPLAAERGDRIVTRIDAAIRRARAQRLDVREPRPLAAGHVEHRPQGAPKEVLRLRDSQRYLPPHFGGSGDAAAAAVPLVEIGAVVTFGQYGPATFIELSCVRLSVTVGYTELAEGNEKLMLMCPPAGSVEAPVNCCPVACSK